MGPGQKAKGNISRATSSANLPGPEAEAGFLTLETSVAPAWPACLLRENKAAGQMVAP